MIDSHHEVVHQPQSDRYQYRVSRWYIQPLDDVDAAVMESDAAGRISGVQQCQGARPDSVGTCMAFVFYDHF